MIKEFPSLQAKALWRCSPVTRTKCCSWRSSKAPKIHLTTLIAMRPGKTIKPFYKVRWHKNAGRAENEGGNISEKKTKNHSPLLSFFLYYLRVCSLIVCVCVCLGMNMCVHMCVFEATWLASMGGLVSRSLSAITHVHLHTLWASVGMKRGLWLRLILEGHALNTTVNNRAIWVVHTRLNSRGESWGDTIWLHICWGVSHEDYW